MSVPSVECVADHSEVIPDGLCWGQHQPKEMAAACLFPGALALSTPQEMVYVFHQDHSNSPYPFPSSLIAKHTLECQTHLPPPDPYLKNLSLSLSLSKALQQMLPFHIWAGKISFFPLVHVRICRHDNLRRWTANVTSASQPIAFLFTGQRGSVMGFTPMTLGLSRCAHMNENESAGLSGVARRDRLKCHKMTGNRIRWNSALYLKNPSSELVSAAWKLISTAGCCDVVSHGQL